MVKNENLKKIEGRTPLTVLFAKLTIVGYV